MNAEAAARTCDNCGQPVLISDRTCWHCGARLAPRDRQPADPQTGEETAGEVPLMQTLFYAVLLGATVLALLLVIRSLGRQPRLSGDFDAGMIPKVTLFGGGGAYSIDVPAEWEAWYFPQENRGQGVNAAALAADERFAQGLQPLLDLSADGELLLLAQSDADYLGIARSERLGQLAIEDVLAAVNGDTFAASPVSAAAASRTGQGAAAAALTLDQRSPAQRCRQYFLPFAEGAYLAAVCTSPQRFTAQADLYEAILQSLTVR